MDTQTLCTFFPTTIYATPISPRPYATKHELCVQNLLYMRIKFRGLEGQD
jgi:hypothetical protein